MRRSATEVLRRGFDSTLANWPLILIRIAEGIVFVGIVIASIVAAIVPIAVAAGLSRYDVTNAANPAETIAAAVMQHWLLIVYVLMILLVVLLLLVAIHSFVEAGTAQVFVDAERRARTVPAPPRQAFRAFTVDRWMAGGRQGWWSVFWIYNATWSVAGLIMLIPLIVTMAVMFAIGDMTARVIAGCGGLGLSVLIMLPVAVIVAIWTQKAITVCIARAATTSDALRQAWREMRDDFGRERREGGQAAHQAGNDEQPPFHRYPREAREPRHRHADHITRYDVRRECSEREVGKQRVQTQAEHPSKQGTERAANTYSQNRQIHERREKIRKKSGTNERKAREGCTRA